MRELLKASNPILRQECEPVVRIDSEIKSLAEDMISFMLAHREDAVAPVGLAAPQLGVSVRVITFYYNPSYREKDGIEVVINPELSKQEDTVPMEETCLSLPGSKYIVSRARRIRLHGLNLNEERRSYKGRDLLAQVFQHEVNHLDGILIDVIGQRIRR